MSRGESELYKDKIEVSLDGRQIFYLFFGGAVVAAMVFVLGVMVGRRVEARSLAQTTGLETQADPLAALDSLEPDSDELMFPSALRGDEVVTLGAVDRALGHTTGSATASAGSVADEPEKAAPAAEEDQPEEPPVVEEETKKEKNAGEDSAAAADEDARASAPDPDSPNFTLQVGSFQSREEAEAFHQELRAADYEPYIAEVDLEDKGVWFRVRLGGFDSYEDALTAKASFEDEQHIIAYVTRLKSDG